MEIPEIDVLELARELQGGGALIDVRQLEEWEEARVPGVKLIPLDELEARVGEVPTDGRLYVICKSGGRSGHAVKFLRHRGVDAVNVAGGTLAWVASGEQVDSGPS